MHQRELGSGVATPSTEQSDISAAVDHLKQEVARLGLQITLMESLAHATEVARAAECLRAAAFDPGRDDNPPLRAGIGCDEAAVEPDHSIVPMPVSANTEVGRTELAEANASVPEFTVSKGESAIAEKILNLHERLGSFLKP
jgi:hypothetical protein